MSFNTIEDLLKELEKKGYIVKKRENIRGLSGILHTFDFVIENPNTGKRVAITVTDRVDYEHILSLLASRIDTNVTHIVIAKSVNPAILSLLKESNIFVFSSPNTTLVGHYGGEGKNSILKFILELLG